MSNASAHTISEMATEFDSIAQRFDARKHWSAELCHWKISVSKESTAFRGVGPQIVAQLGERKYLFCEKKGGFEVASLNQLVVGSIPTRPTNSIEQGIHGVLPGLDLNGILPVPMTPPSCSGRCLSA